MQHAPIPVLPTKYRQEVRRFEARIVDWVCRNPDTVKDINLSAREIAAVRKVLDDTSWEFKQATDNWVYFVRHVEGSFA